MHAEVRRLLRIFREVLDNDDLTFDVDSEEPIAGWDSLAHVQLMSAIEEEFDASFTVEEMARMSSIAVILTVLRSKGVVA